MSPRILAAAACLAVCTPVASTAQDTSTRSGQDIAAFLAQADVKRKMVSAENGDPYSMVWLGDEIQKQAGGFFITNREILPFRVKMYMGAIEKGYAPAYNRMAKLVLEGKLPEGGQMDALEFYRKGAELGDVVSTVEYATMAQNPFVCSICSKGDDGKLDLAYGQDDEVTKQSLAQVVQNMRARKAAAARAYVDEKAGMLRIAMELLSSEAVADDWPVQDRLARIYLNGVKRPDLSEFTGYGDPASTSYLLAAQPERAKPILERMSAKGRRGAHETLADLYLVGTYNGFPRDRERFITYAGKAADAGSVSYAYKLGHEMVAGQNFAADYDLAARYLHKAHEAGYADATLDLAFMFYTGRGVPENDTTALALFEQAADRGSSKAAATLATHWRDGVGGTRNPMRAKIWADKAEELAAAEARGRKTIDAMNALGN